MMFVILGNEGKENPKNDLTEKGQQPTQFKLLFW